ncbi:MAG: hypothetical protein NT084_13325 [Bacteroidetes bacterium]|nr:hypothetical protein [Bacteroidota bacterium]
MRTYFLFFIFIAMYATSFSQTTQEEYNYLTKGYKTQVVEQGGDLKKGYVLEQVCSLSDTLESTTMYCFKRISGEQKTIAAYLIVYSSGIEGYPTEYICIPSPGSSKEIFQSYASAMFSTNDLPDPGCYYLAEKLYDVNLLLSKYIKWN